MHTWDQTVHTVLQPTFLGEQYVMKIFACRFFQKKKKTTFSFSWLHSIPAYSYDSDYNDSVYHMMGHLSDQFLRGFLQELGLEFAYLLSPRLL